jgi:Methyltransferase domain
MKTFLDFGKITYSQINLLNINRNINVNTNNIKNIFDTKSIYDYKPEYSNDLQGWNWDSEIFLKLIEQTKPLIIIEIGTWKGASAIQMANICKKLKLNTKILCVDTFLGSSEHFFDWSESLNLKYGYPQLYYQFISNVIHNNCQDIIIPIPNTSANAYEIFEKLKITSDLIYIDGSHSEKEVYSDLDYYYNLLNKNGIIFGDDFNWDGVAKAVKNFCSKMNINLDLYNEKYIIKKI